MTKRRAVAILKLFDPAMTINGEVIYTNWYALEKLLEVAKRDAKSTIIPEVKP